MENAVSWKSSLSADPEMEYSLVLVTRKAFWCFVLFLWLQYLKCSLIPLFFGYWKTQSQIYSVGQQIYLILLFWASFSSLYFYLFLVSSYFCPFSVLFMPEMKDHRKEGRNRKRKERRKEEGKEEKRNKNINKNQRIRKDTIYLHALLDLELASLSS